MMLKLLRMAKRNDYTIGKLYCNGAYLCDTLEDKDRGLTSEMSDSEILKLKVKGKTCIPSGIYIIDLKYKRFHHN